MQAQCWICPKCFDDRHHIPGDEYCISMNPPKRPYAQQNAQRRSIYTDDETWLKLLDLGERATGKRNASAGIREAVRKAQEKRQ